MVSIRQLMKNNTQPEGLVLFHLRVPEPSELVEEAVKNGWQGNLPHCALAWQLLTDENVFSLVCERRSPQKDSLYQFALRDMEKIFPLFHGETDDPLLSGFTHESAASLSPAAGQVTSLAASLAEAADAEEMLTALVSHYEARGVGQLGLGQLFRVKEEPCSIRLLPARNPRPVHLSDLVGYESQKEKLVQNTLAFLQGACANNVLLYGDAGTGKSTSIQALSYEYASQGLRLIELHRDQYHLIPEIVSRIKNRNYRFILFLDDLSFEENEVEYKQLKAAIEGGGEAIPDNILIYATSNRRHLIRETWNDRQDMEHQGDIHRSDTMEEKLSLSGRFGLQIFYPNPNFEEYHTIVRELAGRSAELSGFSDDQLRSLASTWQVQRGNRSGRTARQFVNSLITRKEKS